MQNWINERYGDQETFDFYAANVNENANFVAEYVEQIGLEIPVILVSSQIYSQYQLRGGLSPYPVDYIIDGEGIVQYANHEYEPELMLMTIDRLLEMDDNNIRNGSNINPNQLNGFILHNAWPNPFNRSTQLKFEIYYPQVLSIDVFSENGREVITLGERFFPTGVHWINLDATDLSSGTYLCRFQAGNRGQASRLILIK